MPETSPRVDDRLFQTLMEGDRAPVPLVSLGAEKINRVTFDQNPFHFRRGPISTARIPGRPNSKWGDAA